MYQLWISHGKDLTEIYNFKIKADENRPGKFIKLFFV